MPLHASTFEKKYNNTNTLFYGAFVDICKAVCLGGNFTALTRNSADRPKLYYY